MIGLLIRVVKKLVKTIIKRIGKTAKKMMTKKGFKKKIKESLNPVARVKKIRKAFSKESRKEIRKLAKKSGGARNVGEGKLDAGSQLPLSGVKYWNKKDRIIRKVNEIEQVYNAVNEELRGASRAFLDAGEKTNQIIKDKERIKSMNDEELLKLEKKLNEDLEKIGIDKDLQNWPPKDSDAMREFIDKASYETHMEQWEERFRDSGDDRGRGYSDEEIEAIIDQKREEFGFDEWKKSKGFI